MFPLRHLLTNVKDNDEPEDKPGTVYKIKCSDSQATYIGETDRNLTTWLNEHKRATKKDDLNNNIAEYHLKTSHSINRDSATCVTHSIDYYQRITLESWFTNLEQTALNRCQPLPAPNKRLFNRRQYHPLYLHNVSPHTSSQPITSQVYQRLLYLLTDQIVHQGFLIFNWLKSITWLWRWLPHGLSIRQSPTTVLLRTPVTQMIIFNQSLRFNCQ